jgi:hypothetical protein
MRPGECINQAWQFHQTDNAKVGQWDLPDAPA